MWDEAKIRAQFPFVRRGGIYLDTAATAQKPQCVIDAMAQFYAHEYGTVHRAVHQFATHATERYQAVREEIAQWLNAECSEEIIFTRGTTDAINAIATSFGHRFVSRGDEIVVTEVEHHANILPWQRMCEERGAILRVAPVSDCGELDLEQLAALLSPRTRLVSVAHTSNVLGTVHPIRQIADLAHQVGACLFVDGAQAVGHQVVDVQALGADFFAASGHKMYGPTGVGILYGRRAWLEELPPYQRGGDMVEEVLWEGSRYQPPPLRFEAGTPMIAEVIGLGAACQFLETVGWNAIYEHEQKLLQQATELLSGLPGVRLIGTAAHKGPILTFVSEYMHPLDLASLLDLQGIAVRSGHMCAQPTLRRFGVKSAVRLSFGLYNTSEEIALCGAALQDILSRHSR